MKWGVKNTLLLLCFIHSSSYAMENDSQQILLTTLPPNVQNNIGKSVVYDLYARKYKEYFDCLDTQSKHEKNSLITSGELVPKLYSNEHPHNIHSQKNTFQEKKAIERINRGYNYEGVSKNREYKLTKPTTFRKYEDNTVIAYNHHQIFHYKIGDKKAKILYEKPCIGSFDSLIRLPAYTWPESFDQIAYHPELKLIAIRFSTSLPNQKGRVHVAFLPNQTYEPTLLQQAFFNFTVCKNPQSPGEN